MCIFVVIRFQALHQSTQGKYIKVTLKDLHERKTIG
jgi:hypothetical protein